MGSGQDEEDEDKDDNEEEGVRNERKVLAPSHQKQDPKLTLRFFPLLHRGEYDPLSHNGIRI